MPHFRRAQFVSDPRNQRLYLTIRNGIEAFWKEVTKEYTEVLDGDYPPEADFDMESHLAGHVANWIRLNYTGTMSTLLHEGFLTRWKEYEDEQR